ncbi:hypothetical protein ACFL0H_11105 [Thermodesulfobacteriota bacterium]
MCKTPTYEELEQRITELEQEVINCKLVEEVAIKYPPPEGVDTLFI